MPASDLEGGTANPVLALNADHELLGLTLSGSGKKGQGVREQGTLGATCGGSAS